MLDRLLASDPAAGRDGLLGDTVTLEDFFGLGKQRFGPFLLIHLVILKGCPGLIVFRGWFGIDMQEAQVKIR